jgi:hypothetical protein
LQFVIVVKKWIWRVYTGLGAATAPHELSGQRVGFRTARDRRGVLSAGAC